MQGVQQFHGGVRRVHGDIALHVEQTFRVVDHLDRVDRGMARCLLCRVSWLRRKDAKAQLAGCVEILVLIANPRLSMPPATTPHS